MEVMEIHNQPTITSSQDTEKTIFEMWCHYNVSHSVKIFITLSKPHNMAN
jgi:hypothetical protein